MELKEITYILTIYQYGSITKAADALFLTQPALSKFLKNLENQVGTPLFSRLGNDMVPTYAGRRYLSYAEQIANIRSSWNAECADIIGEKKGQLSIAIPFMRGSCIIPVILTKFYKMYPQVNVILQEEAHSVEKHLLSSKDIDLVIYNDTCPQSSLIHEELGKEEIVLVMGKGHTLAQKAVNKEGCRYPWLDLNYAKNEKFVLHPEDQTTGRLALQLLQLAGIDPQLLLKTRNSDVAISLAAAGMALALAPESYVQKSAFTESPICFSVGAPKTQTTLYAIYRKGRYLPSYAKYFLELVRQYMRDFKIL